MAVLNIPLVGSIIDKDPTSVLSSAIRGQQFRNAVFRRSANSASGGARIEVRPLRLASNTGGPAGTGRGTAVMVWTGQGTGEKVISAHGTTNSTIYSDSSSLGSITGTVEFFSETTISGTANAVAVASNGRAWYYPDGGALTEITDTDYPAKQTPALVPTGNFVHMDGYAFIACTNGQIWNSDLNSISAWTSTSYVTASQKPDGLLGLGRVGDYIYAFGTGSTQPFYNAGNSAGSVLSPVAGGAFSIGALNQYCILQFRDTVAFVGLSAENNVGVYIIEGRQPKKISTAVVDEYLANATYVKLHQWIDGGKHMLYLGVHASSTTDTGGSGFMYDPEIDIWTPTRSITAVNQTAIKRSAAGIVYLVVVNDSLGGYGQNDTTDYATMTAMVGPIGDGRPHHIRSVQILGDGFGHASPAAGTVTIYPQVSDRTNGLGTGKTFTVNDGIARNLGFSKAGQSRFEIEWAPGAAPNDLYIHTARVRLEQYDSLR